MQSRVRSNDDAIESLRRKTKLSKVMKAILAANKITVKDNIMDYTQERECNRWSDSPMIDAVQKMKGSLLGIFNEQGKFKTQPDDAKLEEYGRSFRRFSLTFDVSTEAQKKFTIKLIENEAKKLMDLCDEYVDFKEARMKLKDPEDYMNEALEALKKCTTQTSFKRAALNYGCNADMRSGGYMAFNNFLRRKGYRNISPVAYAERMEQIMALEYGIAKHNYLADKDITLYRGTRLDELLSILQNSGCITEQQKRYYLNEMDTDDDDDDAVDMNIENDMDHGFEAFNAARERERVALCQLAELITSKKPVVCNPGFLSTSKIATVARGFGWVKYVIKVKKGTAIGADITRLSGHFDQQEVLLMPSQKLKILDAKFSGRLYVDPEFEINMETVK